MGLFLKGVGAKRPFCGGRCLVLPPTSFGNILPASLALVIGPIVLFELFTAPLLTASSLCFAVIPVLRAALSVALMLTTYCVEPGIAPTADDAPAFALDPCLDPTSTPSLTSPSKLARSRLHVAALTGDVETASLLLGEGANPNVR